MNKNLGSEQQQDILVEEEEEEETSNNVVSTHEQATGQLLRRALLEERQRHMLEREKWSIFLHKMELMQQQNTDKVFTRVNNLVVVEI